jgi:hypothetical protein
MRHTMLGSAGLLALLMLAGSAAADETVENPEYKKWAVWKEGAYATLKGENRFGDVDTIVTSTQTLKTVSAEKVVVEVTTMVETNGTTTKAPPTTMEHRAREPKLSEDVRRQVEEQTKKFAAQTTKGKESLTVNGKTLACEWSRFQAEGIDSKSWMCDDVPNQMVKMESIMGPLKSQMLLVDWKGTKR